jgi:hypothetical protein
MGEDQQGAARTRDAPEPGSTRVDLRAGSRIKPRIMCV